MPVEAPDTQAVVPDPSREPIAWSSWQMIGPEILAKRTAPVVPVVLPVTDAEATEATAWMISLTILRPVRTAS